jgi:hypothetical protein
MKKRYLFVLVILAISCNQDDFSSEIDAESKIVVEGWIEEGDVPQLILSSSIPIAQVVDSTNVLDRVIRSAKVTVSDGETTEVLRVKKDEDRLSPFVYFGSEIIGKAGRTYTLKIEYLSRVITATTTIPKTVALNSAAYVKNNVTDTTGYIFIKFDDPINEKNYYQITTRVAEKEPIFVPAFYGNLDDKNFDSPKISMQVNRGVLIFPKTKYKPYFTDGDLIFVKLRTMNKDVLDFWNSWQNEIVNSRNPIYPSNISLKSNINGGIGIWAGYGQNTILIRTPSKN